MEVVMMIGIAGSGKTTLCQKLFPQHIRISLDEIGRKKGRKREYKIIEQHLQKGNSIVVDDTNLTQYVRRAVILRAKKYGSRITAVFLDYPMDRIRAQNFNRKRKVPGHVLERMRNELEPPSYDEGFDYIQTLHDDFSF